MPSQERRKVRRLPAHELHVVVRGANRRLEARDVSIEGIGLVGSVPDAAPGRPERLDLIVGETPMASDIPARVAHVERKAMGLAFGELAEDIAETLQRLLARRQPAIDLDYFESRYARTPDLLVRLVTLFFQDSSSKRDQLREAMAAEDYKRAASVAHSLAGSAATLGALRLRQRALLLEQQLKAGNIEEGRLYLQDIEEEVEQANGELAEYLDRLKED